VLPFTEIDHYTSLFADLEKFNRYEISIQISSLEESFINFMKLDNPDLEETSAKEKDINTQNDKDFHIINEFTLDDKNDKNKMCIEVNAHEIPIKLNKDNNLNNLNNGNSNKLDSLDQTPPSSF